MKKITVFLAVLFVCIAFNRFEVHAYVDPPIPDGNPYQFCVKESMGNPLYPNKWRIRWFFSSTPFRFMDTDNPNRILVTPMTQFVMWSTDEGLETTWEGPSSESAPSEIYLNATQLLYTTHHIRTESGRTIPVYQPPSTTVKIGSQTLVKGGGINNIQGYDSILVFWANIATGKGVKLDKTYKNFFGFETTKEELNIGYPDNYNQVNLSDYDKDLNYVYTLYVINPSSSTVFTGFGNVDVYKFKFLSEIAPDVQIVGVENGLSYTTLPSVQVKKKNSTIPYSVSVNGHSVYTFGSEVDSSFNIPSNYFQLGQNEIVVYDGMITFKSVTFMVNSMSTPNVPIFSTPPPRSDYEEGLPGDIKFGLDGLLNLIKMPFVALGKIISTVVGYLMDLTSQLSGVIEFMRQLFSFLPTPVVDALSAFILIALVLAIIKLFRG